MTTRERIKNALSIQFKPESESEIYWFNKCKGMEAELRHLKVEAGKTRAYVQELEDSIKDQADEKLRTRVNRQALEISRLMIMNKQLKEANISLSERS